VWRRLLLVPALALAVTAAVTAPAGAGDQEPNPAVVALGDAVSVVLPRGWHLTSDTRLFREAGRGYQVQIYLGPAAPPSARAQIAAILDSWRVTRTPG
jgi:hypothetical protein